jgi:hypothetical protein
LDVYFNRPACGAYRYFNQFVSKLLRLPPFFTPLSFKSPFKTTGYSSAKVNHVFPAVHTSTPTRVSQEEMPTKITAVLATAKGVSMEKFSLIGGTLRAMSW